MESKDEKNIEYNIKSIEWLEEKKCEFIVPKYQRGYRWSKDETYKLIEDIMDSDNDYFIQPIVYKINEEDGTYNLVDGQQRLTTIYLILKVILKYQNEYENEEIKKELPKYKIKYEAEIREGETKEFLENIDNIKKEEINNKTIDLFHMSTVQNEINKYISKLNKIEKIKEIKDKVERTKFIFFEVSKEDEINFFERINLGKIYLTNGELIKALILNRDIYDEEKDIDKKQNQLEWATLWDGMELELHNEDFLGMFNKKIHNLPNTKIDFILEIVAKKIINDYSKDIEYDESKQYWLFDVFEKYNRMFKKNEKDGIISIWKEIRKCFRTLKSWYDNNEIYHLVGYLSYFEIKTPNELLVIYEKAETKEEFINELYKIIKENKIEIDLDKLKKEINSKEYDKLILENGNKLILNYNTIDDFFNLLNYEYHKEQIRKILLLFNILTFIKNNEKNVSSQIREYKRLSFGKFINQKWELEHIHSRAADEAKENINRENIKKIRRVLNKVSAKKLNNKIREQILKAKKREIKKEDIYTNAFNEFYKEFTNINKEIREEFENSLRNLTLLDTHTNASYKNSIFILKRAVIMENDKNGIFIPICTKNTLLKYYSKNPNQFLYWSDEDAEDYLKEIKRILKRSKIYKGVENRNGR